MHQGKRKNYIFHCAVARERGTEEATEQELLRQISQMITKE